MESDTLQAKKAAAKAKLKEALDVDGFRPIHRSFRDRVGAEALPEVNRHKGIGRLVWSLILITAWAVSIWQCVTFIQKYYSYPYETEIDLRSAASLPFPAVTVCNFNPVRKASIAEAMGKNETAVDNLDEAIQKFLKGRPKFNSNMSDLIDDDLLAVLKKISRVNDNIALMKNMGIENLMESVFYEAYLQMNESLRKSVGHNFDEMIIDCFFKGQRCSGPGRKSLQDDSADTSEPLAIRYWLHQLYGNCITFNADGKANVSMATQDSGLNLLIDAQMYHYMPMLSRSIGIRASIHDADLPPFPEDFGYNLSPGFSTELEIRQVDLKRISRPYTQYGCHIDFPDQFRAAIHKYWPGAKYSSHACRKLCLQNEVMEECGCTFYKYPIFGLNEKSRSNLPPCSLKNVNDTKCIARVSTDILNASCGEMCFAEACNETEYQVRAHMVPWPKEEYAVGLCDSLAERATDPDSDAHRYWYPTLLSETLDKFNLPSFDKALPNLGIRAKLPPCYPELPGLKDSKEKTVKLVRDTVLEVKIYFERLNYQLIEQSASYSVADMFSDFGGAVGLWAGASVLSFFQIVEYFAELVHYRLTRTYMVSVE